MLKQYIRMSIYFKDVKKVSNSGVGAGINNEIVIFDWNDVVNRPEREELIYINETLAFKTGAFMISLEVSEGSLKNMSKDEGDNDSVAVIQEISATVPGNESEFRQLVASMRGRKLGVIHRYCNKEEMDLYGSHCAPLQFMNSYEHDKDNKRSTINFKSIVKGPDVAIYTGSLFFETNFTLAPNVNGIDLSKGNGVYEIGVNTKATLLTTLTNAKHGEVFTLIGISQVHRTKINASNAYMLRNKIAWDSLDGASITFKVFDNGTYNVAIEQSRT